MRVFMLGWEFPPFISGGLGTACYGLTKALSQQRTNINFVLPKAVGGELADTSEHVRLLSPQSSKAAAGDRSGASVASTYSIDPTALGFPQDAGEFANVTFKAVPARLVSSYQSAGGKLLSAEAMRAIEKLGAKAVEAQEYLSHGTPGGAGGTGGGALYGGDLILETRRYAALCVDLARGQPFDVIHAHDWMTYPAGMAVAAISGKPLVVHVHSTEFDRSGTNINQRVYDIERRGMHAACRVIAVSHLTRRIIEHRYAVNPDKIDVVYNGIDNGRSQPLPPRTAIRRGDKIVLFLGRITMQKGPEYFVEAAKKVLQKYKRVKFVMAGSGDMARQALELAESHDLGSKLIFTGFLRGKDVERVFNMADVYVMPSVSEPFGIAPLEAIRHDVPVIISKQSGVAEVLTHALKVDFWDTDEMANKIIAVLRHPPLSSTLREHADLEVRRLTWQDAATKCRRIYEHAIAMMPN